MRNVSLAFFCTIALATAIHAQQQVANGGFEDWSQVTLYEEIGTWTTINGQIPTNPTTTKVPGYAGSWATHLETRTVGLSTAFGYILQGEVVNDSITGGVPFTTPIDAIEGWYRYDLQPGDSAVVLVGIWSTGVLAVLDVHTIGGSQPAWTAFSLPVNQGVPIAPDSVVVAVTSSNPFALGAAAGSWIEVDDVALTSFIEPNPQELVNADMETWIDVQIEQADDWSSFDPYLAAVGFTSVTKSTQAYAGSFAARVATIGAGNDTIPGLLTNGTVTPFGVTGGVPYTDMPVTLKGFFNREPVGQDTSVIYAVFTLGGVPVGSAYSLFTGPAMGWEPFNIPVFLPSAPDSMNITVLAGNNPGSVFSVDAFEFEFMPTGILEHGGGTPTIFPNPVNEELNVSLNGAVLTRPDWVILDDRGRSVRSGSFGTVAQEPLQVPVASLSPGMYWLRSEVNGSITRLPFMKR